MFMKQYIEKILQKRNDRLCMAGSIRRNESFMLCLGWVILFLTIQKQIPQLCID